MGRNTRRGKYSKTWNKFFSELTMTKKVEGNGTLLRNPMYSFSLITQEIADHFVDRALVLKSGCLEFKSGFQYLPLDSKLLEDRDFDF